MKVVFSGEQFILCVCESKKDFATKIDPYVVLGINRGSSAAVIRSAYARLVLEHHPDKIQQQQQQQQQYHVTGIIISEEGDTQLASNHTRTSSSTFLQIQAAYEALREDPMVLSGSFTSTVSPMSSKRRSAAIAEVLTQEDLVYNQTRNDYTHNCRCGGESVLLASDIEGLAKGGLTSKTILLQCPSCSLSYKVEASS